MGGLLAVTKTGSNAGNYWLSRDPIGERGGTDPHGIVGNNLVVVIECLGLVEIDSSYFPRMQQLRLRLLTQKISAETFQKQSTALRNEWSNLLTAARKKCYGEITAKRKHISPKPKHVSPPVLAVPIEQNGRDSIRVQDYKKDAKEVVTTTTIEALE